MKRLILIAMGVMVSTSYVYGLTMSMEDFAKGIGDAITDGVIQVQQEQTLFQEWFEGVISLTETSSPIQINVNATLDTCWKEFENLMSNNIKPHC